MYYTIEGKRLLIILYLAGVVLGTLIINIGVQKGFFHFYDFPDYTSYITSVEDNTVGEFFSYVLMIRIRQLLMFILGIFILSPYVTYCLFTLLFSLVTGSFISLLVIRFGWVGMLYSIIFSFPQGILYGILLFAAYYYIFGSNVKSHLYRMRAGHPAALFKVRPIMEQRLFVAVLCILSFAAGCVCEGYINPIILKKFIALINIY